MADEQNTQTPSVAPGIETAKFALDYSARVNLMDFLELSYEGGVRYKDGNDAAGNPILVEHEQEAAFASAPTGPQNGPAAPSVDRIKSGKFARRLRIAAYENVVKPIVGKFVAYLTRNDPTRNEAITAEDKARVKLDEHLEEVLTTGLKLTEGWLGVDSSTMTTDADADETAEGEDAPAPLAMTEAQAAAADPEHEGKPYLVVADPRRIVDYDEDEEGNIDRCVVMEIRSIKRSFTERRISFVSFVEWDAERWSRWEMTDERGQIKSMAPGDPLPTTVHVRKTESAPHSFGACPWYRFAPVFPIIDICELARLMFNMGSLIDEELFQNTFTQKWATGVRPADLAKAVTGTSNFIAIEAPQATCGVFGASPDQARNLMERASGIRDAIYQCVSMEATSTKNAPEAAEKKKRDMESLYTSLVKITAKMERMDNWALGMLGMIDKENADQQSTYDDKFDVNSLTDFLAELKQVFDEIPFLPVKFKRTMALEVMQKLDPHGDHQEYEQEAESIIDIDPQTIDALVAGKAAGLITPEMAAMALGIPEDQLEEYLASVAGHDEQQQAMEMAALEGAVNGEAKPGEVSGNDGAGKTGGPPKGPPGGGQRGAPGGNPFSKPGAKPKGGGRPPGGRGRRGPGSGPQGSR